MSDPITIREASLQDFPRCRQVIAETFEYHRRAIPQVFRETDAPPPSAQYISNLLKGGGGALFVAETGSKVIGFLTIRLRQNVDQPWLVPALRAIVDDLGVIEEWRRHGVGRRLMDAAHDWSRRRGATILQLNVWEFNQDALAFYESLGYTVSARTLWKSP
jgi:ribosomal protein S18 acetylase RimI-like enzyme